MRHALATLLLLALLSGVGSARAQNPEEIGTELGLRFGPGSFRVEGSQISTINRGGAAEAAQFQVGDVLFAIDDEMAQGVAAFQRIIRAHCGQTVRIRTYRPDGDGMARDVTVALGATAPCFGVALSDVLVPVAQVRAVIPASPASAAGVLVGDTILRIDSASGSSWVFTPESIHAALKRYARDAYVDARLNLLVHRGGRSQNVLIESRERSESSMGSVVPPLAVAQSVPATGSTASNRLTGSSPASGALTRLNATLVSGQDAYDAGSYRRAEEIGSTGTIPIGTGDPAERLANARLLRLQAWSIWNSSGSRASERRLEAQTHLGKALYEDPSDFDTYREFVEMRSAIVGQAAYQSQVSAREPTNIVYERRADVIRSFTVPLTNDDREWRLLDAALALQLNNPNYALALMKGATGCLAVAVRVRALSAFGRSNDLWLETSRGQEPCLYRQSSLMALVADAANDIGRTADANGLLARANQLNTWPPREHSQRKTLFASPTDDVRRIEQALRANPDVWSSWVAAWNALGRTRVEALARDSTAPAAKFALAMAMLGDDQRTAAEGRQALSIAAAVLAIRPEPHYAQLTFLIAALLGDVATAKQAADSFFVRSDPASYKLASVVGSPPVSGWSLNSRADLLFEAAEQSIAAPFSQLVYDRAKFLDAQIAARFVIVGRDRARIKEERIARELADLTVRVNNLEHAVNDLKRVLRDAFFRLMTTETAQRELRDRLDRVISTTTQLTRDEQDLKQRVDRLYGWFQSVEGQTTIGAVGGTPGGSGMALLTFLSKYFYLGFPVLGKIEASLFPIIADLVQWLLQ